MISRPLSTKHYPGSIENRSKPARLQGGWWKLGCGFLMCYVIYGAFFIAGGAAGFGAGGDSARAVFFHVPSAILSSICYFVGMFYAAQYLLASRRDSLSSRRSTSGLVTDAKSVVSMELGFLFCLLATITGSIFAGIQWGSFWNWDPREVSIVIMLFLYAGYLVLRGAMAEKPLLRAKISAVYAIIALIPAQYLIWAVPRLTESNHPTSTLQDPSATSISYKLVLYPAFIAFTMLFVWLFQLRFRYYNLVLNIEESK